jgi:hypothetical protein
VIRLSPAKLDPVTSLLGTNSPFAAVRRFRLELEVLQTCWQGAQEACSRSLADSPREPHTSIRGRASANYCMARVPAPLGSKFYCHVIDPAVELERRPVSIVFYNRRTAVLSNIERFIDRVDIGYRAVDARFGYCFAVHRKDIGSAFADLAPEWDDNGCARPLPCAVIRRRA